MSFSGAILYALLLAGAGAGGVEFGKRHPDDAWRVLRHKVKKLWEKIDRED